RLRLHQGVPGREAHARREAAPDLRGHVADPARGHRPQPLLQPLRPLALLALAACGSAASTVSLSQYGGTALDSECDWAVRCRYFPDDATCRRVLDPKAFDLRAAEASVAAGRLRYDPEAAARCLDAGRAALCPAAPFADPSCAKVFVGLV